MKEMQYRFFDSGNLKIVDEEEERTLSFTISDETVDRYREIMRAKGCDLTNYLKNPVVLWAHNHSIPVIGRAYGTKVKAKSIFSKVEFAPNEFSVGIYELYKRGFMKGVSIGFIPHDTEEIEQKEGDKTGAVRIHKEWELLEFSMVDVGADPNALATAKELNLPKALVKSIEEWHEQRTDFCKKYFASALPIDVCMVCEDVVITEKELIDGLKEIDKQRAEKEAEEKNKNDKIETEKKEVDLFNDVLVVTSKQRLSQEKRKELAKAYEKDGEIDWDNPESRLVIHELLNVAAKSPILSDMMKCAKCGELFDFSKQPEVAMGFIKCPKCGAILDQEGKEAEEPKDFDLLIQSLSKEEKEKLSELLHEDTNDIDIDAILEEDKIDLDSIEIPEVPENSGEEIEISDEEEEKLITKTSKLIVDSLTGEFRKKLGIVDD